MKFIKGKKIADEILEDIKRKIKKEKPGIGLAVVLIGEDKASKIYTRLKKEAAEKIGINFYCFKFRENYSDLENAVIKKIKELNADERISGIIVQLPLPKGLDTQKIINSIDPRKDADGFHLENIKLFCQWREPWDKSRTSSAACREELSSASRPPKRTRRRIKNKENFWPVFPKAIVKMIESAGVKLNGKKAIVITNSEKFGKIMVGALKRKNIEARYILSSTLTPTLSQRERGISDEIKKADIIITACGILGLIKGGMIKKGAIIIDGGITKKEKKVLGDVDIESVKNIAGYVSPVPGGVGPVTVACLLENVLILNKK